MGNFVYVGSLYRNNWGECDNKPGYIELDPSTGSYSYHLADAPPMFDIELTESNYSLPNVLENALVRVTLKGSAEWIETTREHTRSLIVEKFKPRKLFFESDYLIKEIPRVLISQQSDPYDAYCIEKSISPEYIERGRVYLA
jgi:hypothetical protein